MELEHNHHDDAVDKVLAALRDTSPPEGMEARITQRLTQAVALPQPAGARWPEVMSRGKDILAGATLAGAWARGAFTGAAVALLAVAAVFLLQHSSRTNHSQPAANNSTAPRSIAAVTPVRTSGQPAPTSPAHAIPCVGPHLLHTSTQAPTSQRPASFAPSRPAPELPLTAPERALARLAETADPRLLAALAPETQARLDAQETDNFNKFFAPPPAPPQPADTASPTNIPEDQAPPKEGEHL